MRLEKREGFVEIEVKAARELIQNDKNTVVLDVRTEEEYWSETGHIEGSILIPIDNLEQKISQLEQYKERPIILFCYVGQRSKVGCQLLAKSGFKKLYNVIGGMMEWCDANFEVVGVNQLPKS